MPHLLLLHGAIGCAAQLAPLEAELSAHYTVHKLDFSGHGGRPFSGSFSIASFADDVLHFMQANRLTAVSIFGYSMGGYVAVYLAKHYPGKIEKVITLGTKYHWDESIAAKETQMLNPEKIMQKVPAFADSLARMHAPNDWKEVLAMTVEMMNGLGKQNILNYDDYASIVTPSLVMLGDRDKMVSLDETVAVYKSLPAAQMSVLPNTPHPIDQADAGLLAYHIRRFLQ